MVVGCHPAALQALRVAKGVGVGVVEGASHLGCKLERAQGLVGRFRVGDRFTIMGTLPVPEKHSFSRWVSLELRKGILARWCRRRWGFGGSGVHAHVGRGDRRFKMRCRRLLDSGSYRPPAQHGLATFIHQTPVAQHSHA